MNPVIPAILIAAIIEIESGGDPQAVGRYGERGLMQIMPGTWKQASGGLPFTRAFDPTTNVMVGKAYLIWLSNTITKWQGRPATLRQVVAAYNGGIGRLRKREFNVERMPKSTREYVNKVMTIYRQETEK